MGCASGVIVPVVIAVGRRLAPKQTLPGLVVVISSNNQLQSITTISWTWDYKSSLWSSTDRSRPGTDQASSSASNPESMTLQQVRADEGTTESSITPAS